MSTTTRSSRRRDGTSSSSSSSSEDNVGSNKKSSSAASLKTCTGSASQRKRSRGSLDDSTSTTTKRTRNTKVSEEKQEIPLSNRYEVLMDITDESTPPSTAAQTMTQTQNSQRVPKPVSIPPINVIIKEATGSTHKYFNLRAAFKEADKNGQKLQFPPVVYKLKNDVMSVRAAVLDDYRFILHKLEEKGFEYYLFKSNQENPPSRLVLRGLPKTITPQEINEELLELGVKADNISQMKSGKDRSLLPLFLITISQEETDILKKVQTIAYMKVRFEDYVPPKGVKQCFKCQRFHHTTKTCHATARCFKCSGPHESKDCPATKENLIRKCVNCGGDHFSLYKGCDVFKAEKVNHARRVVISRIYRDHGTQAQLNFSANFPPLKPKIQASNPKSKEKSKSKKEPKTVKEPKATKESKAPKLKEKTIPIYEKPSYSAMIQSPTEATNAPNMEELGEMIEEAMELCGDIAALKYELSDATGLVTKQIGRMLKYSLRLAEYKLRTKNGSNAR